MCIGLLHAVLLAVAAVLACLEDAAKAAVAELDARHLPGLELLNVLEEGLDGVVDLLLGDLLLGGLPVRLLGT